ncbi:hypothetical protein C943_01949 [Mariniradius saccharolyticus AK6]|uniref:Uncharacterized protein n=1 Tax=Mariniradius saccharolyticus AK6 TaxID=1239962 RepID=M7XAK4_9BACT|nr:hypothetical protein C943_01949 [Mariniradius saccharolyticus AK6]
MVMFIYTKFKGCVFRGEKTNGEIQAVLTKVENDFLEIQ